MNVALVILALLTGAFAVAAVFEQRPIALLTVGILWLAVLLGYMVSAAGDGPADRRHRR